VGNFLPKLQRRSLNELLGFCEKICPQKKNMQKHTVINFFLILILLILGCLPSLAQSESLPEKKSLILEFRRLTGANNVRLSLNLTVDDVQQTFLALIEQEKDLTESHQQELKKLATEATTRIDKLAKEFLADKPLITKLSEEVIYQIYDQNFTEAELKELISFYKTPIGQKAAAFLPTVSAQVQKGFYELVGTRLQNIMQPAIQREKEQLNQKAQELRNKKTSD
jgi:hypothetical protein